MYINFGELSVTSTNEVRIEISTSCNYRCVFCPQLKSFKRKREIMSNELFQFLLLKVKRECPQITDLTLSGLGEAATDNQLLEKVEYAKTLNYKVHILTNGSLLSKN